MASDTRYPGTCVSDASVGAHAWSSPENATFNDDNAASCSLDPAGESEYLWADDFDFSAIPGGGTIVGVECVIEQRCTVGGCREIELKLVKGGFVTGDNKASLAYDWDASFTAVTRGGAADLWGATLSVADVQDAQFGVALRVVETDATYSIADVDYVQLVIYYETAAIPDGPSLVYSITSTRPVRRQSRSSVLMVATIDQHVAAVETFEPVLVQALPARAMPRRASSSVTQIAQMPAAVADVDITSAAPQVVQSAAGRRATRTVGRSTVLTLWPTSEAGVCDCEIGGVVIVRVGDYRVEIVDQPTNTRDSLHPFRALIVGAGDYRAVPIDECDC